MTALDPDDFAYADEQAHADAIVDERECAEILAEIHGEGERMQVCCPSPEAAAARLCGCGGQPYV